MFFHLVQKGFGKKLGSCSFKSIQSSNNHFYGSSEATSIWAGLTASMAHVNEDFRRYRGECHTFSPPRVSCKLLDFEGLTNDESIVRLGEIMDEICCKCKDSEFCSSWYDDLLQIESLVLGQLPTSYENKEDFSFSSSNIGVPFSHANLQSSLEL